MNSKRNAAIELQPDPNQEEAEQIRAAMLKPITREHVSSLVKTISEGAVDRPTLNDIDRSLLNTARDLEQLYIEKLAEIKDISVLETIHGLLVSVAVYSSLRPLGATEREKEEIKIAAAALMRQQNPGNDKYRMRCLLIAKHYNVCAGGVMPSAEQMMRSAALKKLFEEYLPGESMPSLSAFKRMKGDIVGGKKDKKAKSATHTPNIVKAAGMRRVVKKATPTG